MYHFLFAVSNTARSTGAVSSSCLVHFTPRRPCIIHAPHALHVWGSGNQESEESKEESERFCSVPRLAIQDSGPFTGRVELTRKRHAAHSSSDSEFADSGCAA